MLKINCFLYAARVQDCKRREAYLSMRKSRKQPYLPLIKTTKTQYKEGEEEGLDLLVIPAAQLTLLILLISLFWK